MTSTAEHPTEIATIDGLPIRWDARLLRPRPWTAAHGSWAAELAETTPAGPILELCSGAGHIGLVAARRSGRDLVQVDREPAAAAHGRVNADAWAVTTEIRTASVDEALAPDERFPIVVVDPPWLTSDQLADYPEDPRGAVDGGADGMTALRVCLRVALDHVCVGGAVVLQAGHPDQVARVVKEILGSRHRLVEVRDLRPGGVLAHFTREQAES